MVGRLLAFNRHYTRRGTRTALRNIKAAPSIGKSKKNTPKKTPKKSGSKKTKKKDKKVKQAKKDEPGTAEKSARSKKSK